MLTGIEQIAAERQRQVEVEGWTPAHDDQHDVGELADAAACYALTHEWDDNGTGFVERVWPWDIAWWKPTPDNPQQQLAKAGALIAAEIDRLNRMEHGELTTQTGEE